MLAAAAVCPHPPVLIPAAMGTAGAGPELGELRAACAAAARGLLLARPDVLVVVGGGDRDGVHAWPVAGSLRPFSVPWPAGPAAPSEPALPLSLTAGAWLLGEALVAGAGPPAVQLRAVAAATPPDGCLRLGAQLAALAPRVALLAMGDACARKATGVHGAADPAADRYDAAVAAALGAADAGALARLDPGLDAGLMIAGRAAWQVLAGAAAAVCAGPALRGQLRFAAAPFGVSYLVASWDRDPAAGAGRAG